MYRLLENVPLIACLATALLSSTRAVADDSVSFGANEPLEPLRFPEAPTSEDAGARPSRVAPDPAQSAEETLLAPFTVSPRSHSGQALAKSVAGYDQAVGAFVSRSTAEARVLSFLTLRMDFEHGPGMGPDNRFGVGARVQLLNHREHGVDGGLGLFYQPNDFRDEGHVVGALLVGRSFGRFGVFANALVGGDPEGDDAAAEGRLSALLRVTRAFRLGWDSRFRYNMSTDEKRNGTLARDWELQSLPSLSYTIGPMALLAEAGLSMLQVTGPYGSEDQERTTQSGFLAMAGAGGAF